MRNIKCLAITGLSLIVVFAASETFVPKKSAEANGVYQCECSDLSNIEQKIDEIEAAIRAYKSEIGNQWNKPYTPQARDALNKKVQGAINQAMKGRRPLNSRGHVNNNCDIKVEGPTLCLKTATTFHEGVHAQACLKTKNPDKIIESVLTRKDRFERDNFTMDRYAQEEINGYSAALDYLKEQLASLRKKCK